MDVGLDLNEIQVEWRTEDIGARIFELAQSRLEGAGFVPAELP